jgi:hypothetical protein
MRWQAALVGAAMSLLTAMPAAAEIRIVRDPGGEVAAYLRKFAQIRNSGQRVVIDGPCYSACTLLVAAIPKDRICVTRRAVLGFHAASIYNTASRTLVPTRAGTNLVMQMYPPAIRRWIERRGGLTPKLIFLRGRELAAMYRTCS